VPATRGESRGDQGADRLHEPALRPLPDLTVIENLHFYADIYGVPRRGAERKDRPPAGLQQPHAVQAAPGRQSLRRHEAEARPGLRADPHAARPLPRRADQRRRPGLAARFLAHPLPTARETASPSSSRPPTSTKPSAATAWASIHQGKLSPPARPTKRQAVMRRDPPGNPRTDPRRAAASLREQLPAGTVGPVRRSRARGDAPARRARHLERPSSQGPGSVASRRTIEPSLEDVFVSP
jgi:ABC-2 type transport system ATP-binding protein